MRTITRLAFLLIFVISSLNSSGWRKDGNTIYLDKGDYIWDVSYSLLGDGNKWQLLWDLRVDTTIDSPIQAYPNMKFILNDSIFHETRLIYVDTLHVIYDTTLRLNPNEVTVRYIVTEEKNITVFFDRFLEILIALIPFLIPLLISKFVKDDDLKKWLLPVAIFAAFAFFIFWMIGTAKFLFSYPDQQRTITTTEHVHKEGSPTKNDSVYLNLTQKTLNPLDSIIKHIPSDSLIINNIINIPDSIYASSAGNQFQVDTVYILNGNDCLKICDDDINLPDSPGWFKKIAKPGSFIIEIIITLFGLVITIIIFKIYQNGKVNVRFEFEVKARILKQILKIESIIRANRFTDKENEDKESGMKDDKLQKWDGINIPDDQLQLRNSFELLKEIEELTETEGCLVFSSNKFNSLKKEIYKHKINLIKIFKLLEQVKEFKEGGKEKEIHKLLKRRYSELSISLNKIKAIVIGKKYNAKD